MNRYPLIEETFISLTASELFELIKDNHYSFFLDSGMDPQKLGRYSFLGCNPFLVMSSGPMSYWVVVRVPIWEEATGSLTRVSLLLASPTLWGNPFFMQWQPWLIIGGVAVIAGVVIVTINKSKGRAFEGSTD